MFTFISLRRLFSRLWWPAQESKAIPSEPIMSGPSTPSPSKKPESKPKPAGKPRKPRRGHLRRPSKPRSPSKGN